jgi:hypothetical protein
MSAALLLFMTANKAKCTSENRAEKEPNVFARRHSQKPGRED